MAHVCPWWIGYFLSCPLRRFLQNPNKILSPHITEGMTVLDAGCAMGFFTLEMAKLVGVEGKVIAVDLQEKMIRSLERRARKKGLSGRIETRICTESSLTIDDLKEKIDFAAAFNVIHETPDAADFLKQIHDAVKPGGTFLLIEPKGHETHGGFDETLQKSFDAGFTLKERPDISRSYAALLGK